MIYVLGLDPGFKHVGAAILEYPARKIIDAFSINLTDDPDKKIADLSDWLVHNIDNFPGRLSLAAIEEPFVLRNPRDYGKTKEVVGMLKYVLVARGINHIMTSPQAGNLRLGLADKDAKRTDKAKREAARALFGFNINNGHEASAVAAAIAGWETYCVETLDKLEE